MQKHMIMTIGIKEK